MAPAERGIRRYWPWIAGAMALLVGGLVIGVQFADEPLRARMEASLNASLKGYKVQIGTLRMNPFGFSVDLRDGIIRQEANPEPPIASVPRLHASVHWRELLTG